MHTTLKRVLILITAIALATSTMGSAALATSASTIILRVDSTRMEVDGSVVLLDAAPVIIEGRTVLPIRPVVDALEGEITWDPVDRKVTIVKGMTTVEMWIGQAAALVNGTRQQIDPMNSRVTPVIVKSRTMLPLRFVASALGGAVDWNAAERKITLTFAPPEPAVAAPLLVSPAAGVTVESGALAFSWAASEGASSYRLEIVDTRGFMAFQGQFTASTSMTVPSGTLADGSYEWQVTAKSPSGETAPSISRRLTVETIQMSAPVLGTPADGASLDAGSQTFTWSPVSGAQRYALRIANAYGAPAYEAGSLTSTSQSVPAGTLTDGTYSWKVTATSSTGRTSESPQRSFTVHRELTTTELAALRGSVVYIEVSGYKEGKTFGASGSGFFISTDGRLVTNYHVIDGATSGTVKLEDGRTAAIASVLGYDKDIDLAVITVAGSGFPSMTIGRSDLAVVGDRVIAIGSPLGVFQNTVSDGIISKVWADAIQTNAAVSHGSSGGPLLNRYGEVIGIITAGAEAGENIAIAVPSNEIQKIGTADSWTLEQVYEREYGSLPKFLAPPQLLSPASGVVTTMTPTLTWSSVPGATKYWVEVWRGSTFDDRTDSGHVFADYAYVPYVTLSSGMLAGSTTYAWAVWTYGPNDPPGVSHTNASVAWSFTTMAQTVLTAPTLLLPTDPTNDFLFDDESNVFQWTPVIGATSYVIRFTSSLGYVVLTDTIYAGTSYSLSPGRLAGGSVYSWTVTAMNGGTSGPPSASRRFGLVKIGQFSSPAYTGAIVSPWALGWTSFMWNFTLTEDCSYVFSIKSLSSGGIIFALKPSIPYAQVTSSYFTRGGQYEAWGFAYSGGYVVSVAMVRFQISQY